MNKFEKYCFMLAWSTFLFFSCSNQKADLKFDTKAKDPAFLLDHQNHTTKVLFDEGHNNSHTSSRTYKSFVDLIQNDGYKVEVNKKEFRPELLNDYDILEISNGKGKDKKYDPVFIEKKCADIYAWVKQGGSLLLIADHYPFGSAAKNLSEKFGVLIGEGFAEDTLNCDKTATDKGQFIFDNINKFLIECPIIKNKNSKENIHRIIVPDSIWGKKSMIFFTNIFT